MRALRYESTRPRSFCALNLDLCYRSATMGYLTTVTRILALLGYHPKKKMECALCFAPLSFQWAT